jgi:hypothetical protein
MHERQVLGRCLAGCLDVGGREQRGRKQFLEQTAGTWTSGTDAPRQRQVVVAVIVAAQSYRHETGTSLARARNITSPSTPRRRRWKRRSRPELGQPARSSARRLQTPRRRPAPPRQPVHPVARGRVRRSRCGRSPRSTTATAASTWKSSRPTRTSCRTRQDQGRPEAAHSLSPSNNTKRTSEMKPTHWMKGFRSIAVAGVVRARMREPDGAGQEGDRRHRSRGRSGRGRRDEVHSG